MEIGRQSERQLLSALCRSDQSISIPEAVSRQSGRNEDAPAGGFQNVRASALGVTPDDVALIVGNSRGDGAYERIVRSLGRSTAGISTSMKSAPLRTTRIGIS